MHKLERLRGLPLRDRLLVSELATGCVVIALALRVISWRRVSQAMISGSRVVGLRRLPLLHIGYSTEKLSPLVEMASSICPKNRCLVRSMVLLWLLRARGESAEVVLGVRKRAGSFEAHAWAVSERGLIGDNPGVVAEFAVMMSSAKPDQL